MTCPKCNQGQIIKDSWYDQNAVRCPICGKWWGKMPAIEKPMGKNDWKQAGRRGKTGKLIAHKSLRPCPVVGCGKSMRSSNPNPMCNQCRILLAQWHAGAKTLPPPIIQDERGIWRMNERTAA